MGKKGGQPLKYQWAVDFETTNEETYKLTGRTRVYLWHARRFDKDNDSIETRTGFDIDSFLDFAWNCQHRDNAQFWFHNLAFDGMFILYRLLELDIPDVENRGDSDKAYSAIITDKGQWITMSLYRRDRRISICDSLKKFVGLSLEKIARIYGIKGKADLDVHKIRLPDYHASPEDIARVEGDTRILAVAMRDTLFHKGMTRLTMQADAYYDFTHNRMPEGVTLRSDFPSLTLDWDNWLRPGYLGGWTFLNPDFADVDIFNVDVYDVNSLYPYAMHSTNGLLLPRGKPFRVRASDVHNCKLWVKKFYSIFKLKKGKLPTVRDSKDKFGGGFLAYGACELTLTNYDYDLFDDAYEHTDTNEQYAGFHAYPRGFGVYDQYIAHWTAEKNDARLKGDGARESQAKRMLNSLYGKNGEQKERSKKYPYLKPDPYPHIAFKSGNLELVEHSKYLPMAMFITAIARTVTITQAQKLHAEKKFVYSDTDSVHCLDTPPEAVPWMDIDAVRLGAWKHESTAEKARYLRPKAYLHINETEHKANGDKTNPISVKCGGMPDKCKQNVTWHDFHIGAEYEGKLMKRSVQGGCILQDVTYNIRADNTTDIWGVRND